MVNFSNQWISRTSGPHGAFSFYMMRTIVEEEENVDNDTRPTITGQERKERLKVQRHPVPKQKPSQRIKNFNEVSLGYTEELARKEAFRCIQCAKPLCVEACPVHNDIPGFIWRIEQGDFEGAYQFLMKTSNLPDFCGRLCPQEKQCEGSCVVGKMGDPVNIGRLESFVADYQYRTKGFPMPEMGQSTGKKVAVIGSGPAGMVMAEVLAKRGHGVVIFERWPQPGGILTYGIPSFKLLKEIVTRKVEHLESLGVEFRCGIEVGSKVKIDDLFRQGFDAVFLGTGTGEGSTAKIPGMNAPECYLATDFLVRGNLGEEYLEKGKSEKPYVGERVAVIGGGDTAMDVVRTAIRLGAKEVTCVYRRSEAEMPGRKEEYTHAQEEGVKFHFLAAPTEILLDSGGHVRGLRCIRMELGEPDQSGRRKPVPVKGSEFDTPVSAVVFAIGYNPEPLIPKTTEGLKTDDWGLILVDQETGETSRKGVYAAGDNVTGPKTVVHAMAGARKAAQALHDYLMKN